MIGVALEGGGARGAYHAGAIKALHDKKITINGYVGTSIGSINAAIASTYDIEILLKLWKTANCEMLLGLDDEIIQELSSKNITKENLLKAIEKSKQIIKDKGIDTTKMTKFLEGIIKEQEVRKSSKDFGLVTFNVSDSKPIKIFKEDIPKGKLIEFLIASSYLPVFKSSKIIDNKYYLDGGVYDNLPVDMLLEKKYDKIYAVRTNAIGITKKIKDDRIIYIKPSEKLGSLLVFSPTKAKKNINLGYYDTLKVLDNLEGYKFYIKPKKEKYYDELFKNLTPYDLNKLRLEFGTLNKKILAIKLIERLAIEFHIERFRVYSFNTLLFKVKLLIDENHKQYKIIRKMRIKLF